MYAPNTDDIGKWNEREAVAFENDVRDGLYQCDPTCSDLYPRPGYLETSDYSVEVTTAEEAWSLCNWMYSVNIAY